MTAPYTTGTIELENNSTAVVGVGTAWDTSLIVGGTIYVEFDGGNPLPIGTVDSDTEITAALKWTGPSGTYSYAIVRDTSYGQQTVRTAEALATYIQRLNNPALAATAGVVPGSDKLLMFTGANTATVIDLQDLLQGVKFDAEVATLAERAAYDGEAAKFRVLVADMGSGRSAFYTKKTAAAGDWSVAFYITGPTGGTGPYTDITIGDTTTLPAGSEAEVTLVPVSPGVIRLDFALPKGLDGTGTGNVVAPAAPVTVGNLAQFTTTDAKTLGRATIGSPAFLGRLSAGAGDVERMTAVQARQALGGWEFIGSFALAGLTVLAVTGLGAYKTIKISGTAYFSAVDGALLQFSSDNGASYGGDADEFRFTILDGQYGIAANQLQTVPRDANNTAIPFFSNGGDATWPGIGDYTIHNFNTVIRSVTQGTAGMSTGADRFIRNSVVWHKRAIALNALRIFNGSGSSFSYGFVHLEGVR